MRKSAYDLMQEVRKHPHVVFGTIFTWDDVESKLEELHAEGEATNVTLDDLKSYKRGFEKAIESAVMGGGDWLEAIEYVITEASEASQATAVREATPWVEGQE